MNKKQCQVICITVRQFFSTGVSNLWDRLKEGVRRRRLRRKSGVPAALNEMDMIAQAHREWLAARTLFEHVNDPDLVDQAIHRMTAAEKRYVFLLKRARETEEFSKFTSPQT